MELYKKYRPTSIKELVGQQEAVSVLNKLIENNKIPHAVLFTGPSGCGKSTCARILKKHLSCSDIDFIELNCADSRGIDTIRDIRSRMGLAPVNGTSKIYFLDESSKLTNDSQSSLLKMLEDTPSHVYFILATTDPQKLLHTIHTRCTEIKLSLLSDNDIKALINSVVSKEKKKITEEVTSRITECAEGSARKSLVLLGSIIELDNEEQQLDFLQKSDQKRQAIDLCRALMNIKSNWSDITKIIKDLDEEVETVRYCVLGYANSILLSNNIKMAPRAYLIITCFSDTFVYSKKPGLTAACWEIMGNK